MDVRQSMPDHFLSRRSGHFTPPALRKCSLNVDEMPMPFSYLVLFFNDIVSWHQGQQTANVLSVPVAYFFDDQPPELTEGSGTETEFLTSAEGFRLNIAVPPDSRTAGYAQP
jgi:hypothetical protein